MWGGGDTIFSLLFFYFFIGDILAVHQHDKN